MKNQSPPGFLQKNRGLQGSRRGLKKPLGMFVPTNLA